MLPLLQKGSREDVEKVVETLREVGTGLAPLSYLDLCNTNSTTVSMMASKSFSRQVASFFFREDSHAFTTGRQESTPVSK